MAPVCHAVTTIVAAVSIVRSVGLLPDEPRPLSDKPRPLSDKPRPLSDKPRPLSGKPRPLSGKPRPLSGKPRPLSGKPRPLSDEPRPLSDEPRPLSLRSQHCMSAAVAVWRWRTGEVVQAGRDGSVDGDAHNRRRRCRRRRLRKCLVQRCAEACRYVQMWTYSMEGGGQP